MALVTLVIGVIAASQASFADDAVAADEQPFTNSLKTVMVWIAPGEIEADVRVIDPLPSKDSVSRRSIKVGRGFWLAATEATRGQFKLFLDETKHVPVSSRAIRGKTVTSVDSSTGGTVNDAGAWDAPGFPQDDDHPVTTVNIEDAKAFCEWLSRRERKHYRLPNEDEWDFALRSSPRKSTKENLTDQSYRSRFPLRSQHAYDWDDGYVFTTPVGRFQTTKNGLFDMGGSVAEMTAPSEPDDSRLPVRAVFQGASWETDAQHAWEGVRVYSRGIGMHPVFGFRVACDTERFVATEDGDTP